MVSFTIKPEVVNGVFCVAKSDGSLRLIINATPANAAMVVSEKVQLPSPSLLASLELPRGADLHVGKADMYHRLRLPAWMVPYFALPAVSARDVGLEAEFGNVDILFDSPNG
jgi:hypothetical protein